MKIKKHKIELYKTWLILIECQNVDELNKFFKRRSDGYEFHREEIFAHAVFAPFFKSGRLWQGVYLIFNTKDDFAPITAGVIAHEAFHASCFILDKIGANADYDNPEPQAYLIEYIADLVDNFLTT